VRVTPTTEDAGPVLTERAQVEFENVRIEVDG
jgi:hypothetical protein